MRRDHVVATSCCGTRLEGAGSDTNTSTTGSFQCTFPDGPDTSTVSVQVKDSTTREQHDTQTVTVANVAPTVVLTGAATADEGQTKTYSYTVTDPGADAVRPR